ncbi:MAG: DUF364 domain-containing protein [Methanophagales archaeon]|nr:DUF364 domain-containing protein [Methanophagales archaeon]
MDIIKDTIKELENQGMNGTLLNIVITKFAPWTLSYVRYDDGTIGCGCACNEAERWGIPEDVSSIKELLNLNVYDVIDKLDSLEESVFINSLRTSITSALSYRLMNDRNELEEEGYEVEAFYAPTTALLDPSRFVQPGDKVAMVGFPSWAIHLYAGLANEVRITELMDLKLLSVIDFDDEDSNVKIYSASESKDVLTDADVVYITGETIVNETINEILDFSKNARVRIIYGPSSSFYPEVLFERGINVSRPIIFPNAHDFKQRFVLSRGYWYFMRDIKQMLIKRSNETQLRGSRRDIC